MAKLPWIAMGFLVALAAVFQFFFVGYGTTVLLFLCAAALLLFYTFAWRHRWKKAALIVSIAAALGFGCFLAAFVPVLAGAKTDETVDADYLIVMGAGIRGDEPSLSMLNRLRPALGYLQENPGAVAIVSGSQAEDEIVSEASVMKRWLEEQGIDPARILLEDRADSTYENLVYSLAMIEAAGGDPRGDVAIVSSDYHLCRIRLLAEELGCRPQCIAGQTSYLILMLNYAVREAFALWEIWVFGIGN